VKVTKNKDPRAVHVVEPLVEVLTAHRRTLVESQHEGLESGLMFPCSAASARCSSTRRNVDELIWFKSGSCLTEPLLKICKRAGVPEMSPHALRRTWEKMMRKADVDGMVRRSIAGWRTETAQTIYSDVDADDRAAAGRAMLRLVGPDGGARE
jgi:integrase